MDTKHDSVTATWNKGVYVVSAKWFGGAYVELIMPDCIDPSEVINVWNDDTDSACVPFTEQGLQSVLDDWCETTFGDSNPDGDYNLRAYIENASY